jgi:hypothetical protein
MLINQTFTFTDSQAKDQQAKNWELKLETLKKFSKIDTQFMKICKTNSKKIKTKFQFKMLIR